MITVFRNNIFYRGGGKTEGGGDLNTLLDQIGLLQSVKDRISGSNLWPGCYQKDTEMTKYMPIINFQR